MSAINPQFVAQVQKVRSALDQIDYFQLLRVGYDATFDEIRDGYHRQARQFHPDRYYHLGDASLVADLTTIAKRITEAYVILRDERRRERYLENLQADRASSLRYQETHEQQEREADTARAGATPQGRKHYQEATAAWARGEKQKAVQALKMALLFEKENRAFAELLARWQGELG